MYLYPFRPHVKRFFAGPPSLCYTFPMKDLLQKKILKLALRAGELMMRSGAEMYRVEDTIRRICLACGIHRVDTFAIPTGIIVSIDSGERNRDAVKRHR